MPKQLGVSAPQKFSGTTLDLPKPDQIEVTLLGPGFGESALVHIGSSQWIVIDSCVESGSKKPAPLQYLENIGADPATDVRLIVATHWHDDHIRGLARLVSECPGAKFCCSTAMGDDEFLGMVTAYNTRTLTKLRSGVAEIDAIFKVLQDEKRYARRASHGSTLLKVDAGILSHGQPCTVMALSPSDKQVQLFYAEIGQLFPKIETKRTVASQDPNHLTVVTKVDIGETSILLGGDLESTRDPDRGWTAVLKSDVRSKQPAQIFKIPHHGSKNAHDDEVWKTMLAPNPYVVLAPYNKGKKLPSAADIKRIDGLTPNAFSTSNLALAKSGKQRPPAVLKQLREMGIQLRAPEPFMGGVTFRNGGAADPHNWTVSFMGPASRLANIVPT